MPETRRLTHSTCWVGVAGEVVAVERPVLGVERGGHLVERGGVDGAVRDRHADLEGLAEVAQVGGAHELVLARRRSPPWSAPRAACAGERVVDAVRPRPGRARRRATTWVCT